MAIPIDGEYFIKGWLEAVKAFWQEVSLLAGYRQLHPGVRPKPERRGAVEITRAGAKCCLRALF